MLYEQIIISIISAVIPCIVIGIFLIIISKMIIRDIVNIKNTTSESFEVLLSILYSMIAVELDTYEKNIFQDGRGVTNSNFTNFFGDICRTIEYDISSDFMKSITRYVSEEFVYTLIAKKVKAYLTTKIQ